MNNTYVFFKEGAILANLGQTSIDDCFSLSYE